MIGWLVGWYEQQQQHIICALEARTHNARTHDAFVWELIFKLFYEIWFTGHLQLVILKIEALYHHP
jgi:hypothetical protein